MVALPDSSLTRNISGFTADFMLQKTLLAFSTWKKNLTSVDSLSEELYIKKRTKKNDKMTLLCHIITYRCKRKALWVNGVRLCEPYGWMEYKVNWISRWKLIWSRSQLVIWQMIDSSVNLALAGLKPKKVPLQKWSIPLLTQLSRVAK